MELLMQEEVRELAGERSQRQAERTASRRGSDRGFCVAGPYSSRGVIQAKRRNEGNEITLILPRNIRNLQALACCAGACLQSFRTRGNFTCRKSGLSNRRKLGNIQPALTSDDYRCRAWRTELQSELAESLGPTPTVAHYPTGASKWNPNARTAPSATSEVTRGFAQVELHARII